MLRVLALMLVVLAAVPAAAEEPFPARPITIVNPYPPGGQADLSGRPFVASLEKILKQPVVLANKSGAAGAVGMQSVAVAKPDGYTLLITVPSLHTLPEVDKLFGRQPTFTRDQFVPIARLNADPLIVACSAVEYYLWIGLFAPKATQPAVVKALREGTRQAVDDPAFRSALEKIASPPAYMDADEFRPWLDADAARLADVIKKIGKVEGK